MKSLQNDNSGNDVLTKELCILKTDILVKAGD